MRSMYSFRSKRSVGSNLKGRKRRLKLCLVKNNTDTAAMHKKLRDLQKLVPGTHQMDLHNLVQNTANYIFALQLKLNILKDLTTFYGL